MAEARATFGRSLQQPGRVHSLELRAEHVDGRVLWVSARFVNLLHDPAVGDVLATPVTGAYGFAMANNYNGALRPPVVFCEDGDARLVVRRETLDDLLARDVAP